MILLARSDSARTSSAKCTKGVVQTALLDTSERQTKCNNLFRERSVV
jgi:hypothetical protein